MIRFARRVRDIALLIRDLPEILGVELELEVEEQRAREDFDRRLTEVEKKVKDVDALLREFMGVRPIDEEVRRDA